VKTVFVLYRGGHCWSVEAIAESLAAAQALVPADVTAWDAVPPVVDQGHRGPARWDWVGEYQVPGEEDARTYMIEEWEVR
jgi:hypothetical protein